MSAATRSLLFSVFLLIPAAASAQDAPKDQTPAPQETPFVADGNSQQNREARLDRLFDSLSGAKDADEAKRFENTIEALWTQSGSDTADLFAARAVDMLTEAQDQDGALRMLNAALEAKPDYAEGWNKRATLFFMKGDYAHAMRDIRETLRYEPRHYGAWAGLGRILDQTGDSRKALDAYRRAIAINPYMDGLKDEVARLTAKVRGEEL
jgi:Flp pilus assembly protein TadD